MVIIERVKEKYTQLGLEQYTDSVLDFLQSVVIAIAICIVIYLFIAMPNQIEGPSMEPTLYNGEIILTNKLSKWLGDTNLGEKLNLDYNRGDIVVFKKPGHNDFIKRVVGVPGDSVSIKDGQVFINGTALEEDYLDDNVITYGSSFIKDGGSSETVPDNYYFVLGDNRTNSHDSRTLDIGFVNRDWIKGKVIMIYWPLSNFNIFKHPNYNI